jgi:ferredoxin-NADP reductase
MGGWQPATVVGRHDETARARTFRLRLSRPEPHRAGQHYIVRLTAPDGYTAQRSYSVASPPADGPSDEIDLTVERLKGGEVSGFLHDGVEIGDELEVRGPIGGWFVWEDGPALLVGGGSGVVPLMAMLRHARATGRSDLLRLVVSVRSPDDLDYRDEITGPEVTVIYTRVAPPGVVRPTGRLTRADLGDPVDGVTAYVCGSARFADAASNRVVEAGVPVERIRVERFGPTG